jgi:hypothetical protein
MEDNYGSQITPELVAKVTGATKVLRPKFKAGMFEHSQDILGMLQMLAEN